MADFKAAKVVAALPATLEADTVYFVRVGSGFDIKVTNGTGTIVALDLNQLVASAFGKLLLNASDAAAARGSLGLGTAATRGVGTAAGNLLEVNSNYFGVQSHSDFPNGTLIRTSFPAAEFGPSITLKIWGKGYYGGLPHLIMVEAYQYDGGWYATSGINLSGNITNVTIMELDGYVCFWFASTGYWNSFFVEAYNTEYQSSNGSRVTSIENSTKPSGTKVVDIPLAITHNTGNILTTTGQSTLYPMTQKAVTDAINARGFADASGVLTVTGGALSNDMSSFLSQTTKATMRSNLGAAAASHSHAMADIGGLSTELAGKAALNATSTVSGGLKARLSGTTLYLTNNGTNP